MTILQQFTVLDAAWKKRVFEKWLATEKHNKPLYRLANVADTERRLSFCVLSLARYVLQEQFERSPRTKKVIRLASNERWVTGSYSTDQRKGKRLPRETRGLPAAWHLCNRGCGLSLPQATRSDTYLLIYSTNSASMSTFDRIFVGFLLILSSNSTIAPSGNSTMPINWLPSPACLLPRVRVAHGSLAGNVYLSAGVYCKATWQS